MSKRLLVFLFVLVFGALFARQDAQYPVFETDKLAASEYKERRERLKKELGNGTLAVFFTNPVRNRNNDMDYTFRGDSTFLYLTGFEEEDAALILIPSGAEFDGRRVTEVLFVTQPNEFTTTWIGYKMGPENAQRLLGLEMVRSNREFEGALRQLASASGASRLSVSMPPNAAGGRLGQMVSAFETWRSESGMQNGPNVRQIVGRMRGVKSPAEIGLLRKATEISALAHVEAMRSIEPGMREWEISAVVKYVFERFGCEAPGYDPIVGSGPNSTILHYMSNRRRMNAGDIVCMDTAGEYHGYSSDVTRTFPVNGRFSPEQRAIYEIVLAAQEKGISLCRPGNTTSQIGREIGAVLAEGLIRLGIIQQASELGRYYMHGFGHGVGLDVHDPMPGTLEPGVVLTVEPGIYIKEGSRCDPKWWNIGVRIEDCILVTDGAPVNLSAGAPRQIADIEALMREPGIGNATIRPWRE